MQPSPVLGQGRTFRAEHGDIAAKPDACSQEEAFAAADGAD
jgi:hypothetical protein